MKTPTRFIKSLTDVQREELKTIYQTHPSSRTRLRAHAILLSERRYSLDQIADIFEVDRDTVGAWLDRWEQDNFNSLDDGERSGRPPILTEKEQEKAIKIVEKDPRSTARSLAVIQEKTGKKLSRGTLKRLLKKKGKIWKRMRKSLKSKRNEQDFRAAQTQLQGFFQDALAGEFDLYYCDEAGFTLEPVIPYAWTDKGTTLEIPSAKSDRLNVLGFLGIEQQFHPFVFEGSITSEIAVACFEQFSQTIVNPTLVVIDQAPIHTSKEFTSCLPQWEERGLYLYLLPAYSPELNWIEMLWRKIKYEWLPLSAYLSYDSLKKSLMTTLKLVGSKYQIIFG